MVKTYRSHALHGHADLGDVRSCQLAIQPRLYRDPAKAGSGSDIDVGTLGLFSPPPLAPEVLDAEASRCVSVLKPEPGRVMWLTISEHVLRIAIGIGASRV